jgi:hypothetical protein
MKMDFIPPDAEQRDAVSLAGSSSASAEAAQTEEGSKKTTSRWSFDVLTPKHMAWEAGTYRLRAGCWEINLMCHMLSQFSNYSEMYNMEVASVDGDDAMNRLAQGVTSIADAELDPQAKNTIVGLLDDIRESFLEAYKHPTKPITPKKMRDLWTWPDLNESVPPGVAAKFDRIQRELNKGTKDQPDSHHPGTKRFHRGCQACMPFLKVLKNTTQHVPESDMNTHIKYLGKYSLADLYKKKKSTLSVGQRQAIADAKANGIFSEPGSFVAFLGTPRKEEETMTIEFSNDLKCVNGECGSNPDTFCSIAEGGGCSAMSD